MPLFPTISKIYYKDIALTNIASTYAEININPSKTAILSVYEINASSARYRLTLYAKNANGVYGVYNESNDNFPTSLTVRVVCYDY